MAGKVYTAPLATILFNGEISGYLRGLTLTENFTTVEVRGIGRLDAVELPKVSFSGSLQADSIFVDFSEEPMKTLFNRMGTTQQILDSAILLDQDIQIQLFKKGISSIEDAFANADNKAMTIGMIKDFNLESQSLTISEGQASGSNISGKYRTPMTSL